MNCSNSPCDLLFSEAKAGTDKESKRIVDNNERISFFKFSSSPYNRITYNMAINCIIIPLYTIKVKIGIDNIIKFYILR
ncbi:hypothetical protein PAJ34TS1_57240 [Paenibacillus azoreducens]|uniref:Uncharacterized protein n=1 Tax=Paenibacillus azoreducens TaxID=116718 RepID=A0A920CSD5_9BACL|nr:hypothetical protein J34TS1_20880 [Paenibacillus azoreducens]